MDEGPRRSSATASVAAPTGLRHRSCSRSWQRPGSRRPPLPPQRAVRRCRSLCRRTPSRATGRCLTPPGRSVRRSSCLPAGPAQMRRSGSTQTVRPIRRPLTGRARSSTGSRTPAHSSRASRAGTQSSLACASHGWRPRTRRSMGPGPGKSCGWRCSTPSADPATGDRRTSPPLRRSGSVAPISTGPTARAQAEGGRPALWGPSSACRDRRPQGVHPLPARRRPRRARRRPPRRRCLGDPTHARPDLSSLSLPRRALPRRTTSQPDRRHHRNRARRPHGVVGRRRRPPLRHRGTARGHRHRFGRPRARACRPRHDRRPRHPGDRRRARRSARPTRPVRRRVRPARPRRARARPDRDRPVHPDRRRRPPRRHQPRTSRSRCSPCQPSHSSAVR